MGRRLVAISLPLLAGCMSFGGGQSRSADGGSPPFTWTAESYDTTWYVTNRLRNSEGFTREAADSAEYGIVVTRYRERAGPGSDGRFREAVDAEQVDSARFDRQEFVTRLRIKLANASAPAAGLLVYVHGYAVSFGLGITQGAEIAHRGSHAGAMVVFGWPAHTNVVSWPSASAVVTRAYRDDSAAAAASHAAFRSAVTTLREIADARPITIIGHSMGAQLVSEALAARSPLRDSLASRPLAALVLYAPDVSLARLRDTLAVPLTPVATRRIVYASDDDALMDMSRFINKSERAGEATPSVTLADRGFEVVDVTRGRRINGALRKLFEPGHAMRFAATALYDFYGVVGGVSAECRVALGVARRMDDGSWRLTNAPVPRDPPRIPAPDACRER